jgi:CheY-like chemotaxis protein
VEAYSNGPGRGSEFVVTLPVLSHRRTVQPEEELCEMHASARRILVVDDNRDAANLLAETLRFGGFDVATAFDGAEALKVLQTFRADIAILDIGLPTMDGLELARQLRQVDATRSIRLVALTGYGQKGDFTASSAAGFDVHLVKPVTAETLFAAVRANSLVAANRQS